ncbi:hypothetical protein ACFQ9X_17690 [Catenulispora yoronensis]
MGRRNKLPEFDLGAALGGTVTTRPVKATKNKAAKQRPAVEPLPPRLGRAKPFHGRSPRFPPVPTFRGSTAQVQGLYPWLYGGGMPAPAPTWGTTA